MQVFTIGYQGLQLGDMLDMLHAHGITRVVDVRDHAFSMKRGFSRAPLSRALEESGIGYTHLRTLGAPKAVRDHLKLSGDWPVYVMGYLAHLEQQSETLETLLQIIAEDQVALLCFEANPLECHRSLITQRLADQGLVQTVHHIRRGNRDLVAAD
jgi:uncharacterized protein (DUF488 family)